MRPCLECKSKNKSKGKRGDAKDAEERDVKAKTLFNGKFALATARAEQPEQPVLTAAAERAVTAAAATLEQPAPHPVQAEQAFQAPQAHPDQ